MSLGGVIPSFVEVMDERARMLAELAGVLEAVGSEHVLVGGLAVGYHGRVRATVDVDLLVPGRKLGPIARELEARGYQVKSFGDMVRVYATGANLDSDEAIADLVSKDANPVLRAAFEAGEPGKVLGHSVTVVQRGALIALKFHAVVSPSRRMEDRYQDVADIGRVINKRFEPDDAALAHRIAALAYPGAGEELDRLIDDLRNGRPVKL